MAGNRSQKYNDLMKLSLVDAVHERISKVTFNMACEAARAAKEALAYQGTREGLMKYMDVTGNMFASMGITVSRYDRKSHRMLQSRNYAPISCQKRPLREALSMGEFYDLPVYYSGVKADDPQKLAKGRTRFADNGSVSGVAERQQFIKDLTSKSYGKSTDMWTIYTYVAMPYARYVEEKHGFSKARGFAAIIAELVREELEIIK